MSLDIEALYQRYGGMVLRRCRSMLVSEDDAVDAMHDTFVELLRRRERLTDDAPSSLLYRTATFVCLNRLRRRRRRPETPDASLIDRIAALDEPEERSLARGVLSALFGGAPASSRVITTLHLHDGLTLAETAEAVGMSVSGVRKRLRKLRAELEMLEAS